MKDDAGAVKALKGVVGKRDPIERLVPAMPDKKPKAQKPKDYAKLSQKQKFIAAAKQMEVDDTGEMFFANIQADSDAQEKGLAPCPPA